jgi:NAD(P)-dependent dehydrogenase (short-subunit alcohol dehydrogenase family)
MNERFKGQVAVITGGASGIGLACAELLAEQGARVAVADIDESNAIKVAESLGGRGYALDVSVAGDVEAVAQRIEEELGPVTMLVNAAGILQGAAVPPEEVSMQTFDRIYEVNLRGAYAVCVAFGLRMGTRGNGAIVNFGSIAAIRSTPLHAYGPLKAAILRLTENLSAEWGPKGVRVNCVSPGPVLTPPMQDAINKGLRDRKRMEDSAAMGRIVLPREVALTVAFLLSEDASAVTGVNLPVDNGWLVADSWAFFGGLRKPD